MTQILRCWCSSAFGEREFTTKHFKKPDPIDCFIQFCGLYYWIWIIYLPRRGNYEIVQEVEESADGVRNTKLTRRYKEFTASTANGREEPRLIDI